MKKISKQINKIKNETQFPADWKNNIKAFHLILHYQGCKSSTLIVGKVRDTVTCSSC